MKQKGLKGKGQAIKRSLAAFAGIAFLCGFPGNNISKINILSRGDRQFESIAHIEPLNRIEVQLEQSASANLKTSSVKKTKTASVSNNSPVGNTGAESSTILSLINQIRSQNGLGLVGMNQTLNAAAYNKSKDMFDKNYFSHTNPEGNTDSFFVKQLGYSYRAIGSNIARGNFASEEGVFDAWMGSAGHKANILAGFGKEIGYGQYGQYYTLIIAQPS
jgi:uncharacterized protein YkwD